MAVYAPLQIWCHSQSILSKQTNCFGHSVCINVYGTVMHLKLVFLRCGHAIKMVSDVDKRIDHTVWTDPITWTMKGWTVIPKGQIKKKRIADRCSVNTAQPSEHVLSITKHSLPARALQQQQASFLAWSLCFFYTPLWVNPPSRVRAPFVVCLCPERGGIPHYL